MNAMNEISARDLQFRDFMEESDGWGRDAGREAYRKLTDLIEASPGTLVFRISLSGVRRIDMSFASEALVELARRYRGSKGFCLVNLANPDQEENIAAAAQRSKQPIMSWTAGEAKVLGPEPTQGTADALRFALLRSTARAAEFSAATNGVSITNASSKFKQLWEQGYLLRREAAAESGGVEYVYFPIK